MDTSDLFPKKHKSEDPSKSRLRAVPQLLSKPFARRFQRKLDLLVRGQKQKARESLPNLYSLMDCLIREQAPDSKQKTHYVAAETAKKQLSKQHTQSNALLHPVRSSIKLPKVPAAPEITISLIELPHEPPIPLVKKASCNSLLLPDSFKAPSESDGSPNSICSGSFSSIANSAINSPHNLSHVFNDTEIVQRAGAWQPWASHLTPCHRLLDMRPAKNPRIHRYLRKLPKLDKKDAPRVQLDMATCSLGAEHAIAVQCECSNPFQLRNLRQLAYKGVDLFQFASIQPCGLQQMIKPGVVNPTSPVILLHMEGVLIDIHKPCGFDRLPMVYLLRPGVVEGLKLLAKSFSLVFLSSLPVHRFYKVLEFLIQKRVQICAAYSVLTTCEDMYTERVTACFQNYSKIYADLGIKEAFSQRLLLLTALKSDPSQPIFTQTGLRVRLHVSHLPVAMPAKPKPLVTVLVPHLRLEDTALRFSVIAQEVLRVFFSPLPYHGLEDSFHTMSRKGPSGLVSYFTTHKVHEAYYSYLQSPVRFEHISKQMDYGMCSRCRAHPESEAITRLLPENHFVLLAFGAAADQARCEVLESEPHASKAKYATLMEFVQSEEVLD